MKRSKILYIGNDLSGSSKYSTTMETLYSLLKSEGFQISKSSSKKNKIIRMLDMFFTVCIKRKNIDYILIDTYSTFNFYYALVISQFARLLRLKYIPILHGGNLPHRLIKNPTLSKLIFKNAYKNIAPSNYLKIAFEDFGFKTEFVPNVLEINKYNFLERETLQPKLLWVRSFKDLYNPLMAINVLKELLKSYPTAKLCMIGPVYDDSLKAAKKRVDSFGINDSVEFIEGLSKEEWHKKSEDFDVFINTTNFDNTPISVMEAMALGLAVVSTNVGGIPFLIKDNIDGFLVDKNDVVGMNGKIINCIQNNDKSVVHNARNKVERFGWDVVKTQWFQILE